MTAEREGVAERWVAVLAAEVAGMRAWATGEGCFNDAPEGEPLPCVYWAQQPFLALCDRMEAAIRALRQGGGWLPIESAPKDGSYILASDGDDTGCAVVNWDEGGWCYAWHRHDGPMQMHSATHWQPLPPPPSPAKEG